MAYRTVLFDLDHTLLDSDASEALAFNATMLSIGVDHPESHLAMYRTLNKALWRQVELGELSPNNVKTLRFERLLSELGVDADAEDAGDHYLHGLGSHGELFPGVLRMLEDVGAFARLALITNGIGSVQRRRIERLGLAQHFSTIAISGELGVAKPDPAIFHHTFAAMGSSKPTSAVIVGDSLSSDIAGGHNAGIATCWFNPGFEPHGSIQPTFQVQSVEALPDALS